MFNTTTRCYTNRDASDSFDWIVEGMEKDTIDADGISEWMDTLIDTTIEQDTEDMKERAESMTFPLMGYSTSHTYESFDDYVAQKTEEIESELKAEKSEMIAFVMDWMQA